MEKVGMRFEHETTVFDIHVAQYTLSRADYKSNNSPFTITSQRG
jgi:hypothetical protein